AMLPELAFDLPRLRKLAAASFSLATDVADYLVGKGMPFREAHGVVGSLVRECEQRRCELNELPFAEYSSRSSLFQADILDLNVDSALAARDIPGGAAPNRVREAAAALRQALGGS
ncbi:MAG: argininosuccinate lyase, partial [Myxococcales bacterium]|nr:argininosuccinate lyase [Myxococcales bacterium]